MTKKKNNMIVSVIIFGLASFNVGFLLSCAYSKTTIPEWTTYLNAFIILGVAGQITYNKFSDKSKV